MTHCPFSAKVGLPIMQASSSNSGNFCLWFHKNNYVDADIDREQTRILLLQVDRAVLRP